MNKREKQLLARFRALSDTDAESLLAFAEFLAARATPGPEVPQTLNPIERPAEETVIAAIKRLSATYPMLDKEQILHETASLVTQHMVQGRDAVEVIDELELVFQRYYDELTRQE